MIYKTSGPYFLEEEHAIKPNLQNGTYVGV